MSRSARIFLAAVKRSICRAACGVSRLGANITTGRDFQR